MPDTHLMPGTGSSEQQARTMFSASVSNVAFALVLSRQMVDAIRLVRDADGNFDFSPYLNPLVRRGLIVIERPEGWNNPRVIIPAKARLSVPGVLVAELLTQAGMMPELIEKVAA